MKILAIRGKNLASLEGEFKIDFTVEPLKSAGIFAITGCTGAGKSTLLDALCLALFDDTPRSNRAKENIAIPDVRDKLINQKDCRTILRRGTGEGYAEVDFLSLGGEIFRSRWMVKRARGKADGSMQNSEIRLMNLTTATEQQGRKTELLSRITELIGLTFEQFTRSVLLAQGDFATFLKAKQSEKAELLEKLTGTEVYSRISVNIYEKTKLAEQEYNALLTCINNIELLPPERLQELQEEKHDRGEELSGLKEVVTGITQKIKWLDEEEELKKLIRQAEEQQAVLQEEMIKAGPRYQYMAQLEKVQEIRDVYQECKQVDRRRTVYHKQQQEQREKVDTNQKALQQACDLLERKEKERKAFEEKLRQLQPQFIQARELDVKIRGLQTHLADYRRDYAQSEGVKKKLEREVAEHRQQITGAHQTLVKLNAWLDKYRIYENLISRLELVVSLLDDIQSTGQQLRENDRIRGNCRKLLEQEQGTLLKLQQEAEHLQQLLPAEIVAWRLRLQEGQPCPVCGSLHHPFTASDEKQTLHEEELEKARKVVAEQITRLQARLEQRQTEIARLSALIEDYKKHEKQTREKARTWLIALPEWEMLLEKGSLQHHLKELAERWQKYTTEQVRQHEQLRQLELTVKLEETNWVELEESLKVKEAKCLSVSAELAKLQQQRNCLLRGEAVELVEKTVQKKRETLDEEVKLCMEKQNELNTKQEACKATLAHIKCEIQQLVTRSETLHGQIKRWLSGLDEEMTPDKLAELLAKDMLWVQEEKRFLGSLKEQENTLKATLAERRSNWIRHQQTDDYPLPETESREILQESLTEKKQMIEHISGRLAEIELRLANHLKSELRIKSFEKELLSKREVTENWKKLNELFGSASGTKFKEIAQGYTLDVLLVYANKHLQALSERYKLQRIPETLALQVIDLDMLGETRTVHSLSGGESFLISLALALGLASLSSNRMNIGSLFIDEGFGSLDADTLGIAMDALERLQTQGKKIGVISHVTEMTERIATQIQVLKSSHGRSEVRIMGS